MSKNISNKGHRIYELFITFVPKFIKLRYENKIWITRSCVPFGSDACFCQRKLKKVEPRKASKNRLAEIYADSLLMCRQRIDSMKMDSGDSRYAQLFTPLTFYHGPAARMLRLKPQDGVKDSLRTMLDQTLMEVYLKRPDLVRNTELISKEVGAPLAAQSKPKKNHPDIVEQVAPKAIEVDAAPMDIIITRPNFWTIGAIIICSSCKTMFLTTGIRVVN